jgi:membrane protease YdiL (CAAX protease family)
LPIVTPILMWSTIAPYEFAVSSYPDARVLVTTMFVLITALVVWGANLGNLLARFPWMRSAPATAVALLLAVVLAVGLVATSRSATLATLGQAEAARAYAQSWDTRDGNLRQAAAAGAGLVPAASLRHMGGLAEIGRDPEEWINRCVAGTYGVGAVVAK